MVFIRNYHGRSLISIMTDRIFIHRLKNLPLCLPSRRLEVEHARERKTRVSRSRAPVLSCAHQFQAPTTQASCLWKSSTTGIAITFHFNGILYFLSFFFTDSYCPNCLMCWFLWEKGPVCFGVQVVLVFLLSYFILMNISSTDIVNEVSFIWSLLVDYSFV